MTRRSVLRSGLASALASVGAALTGCSSPAPEPADGTPKPVRHRYGPHDQQFGDLYLPSSVSARGTVVVIHGGFWQSQYALDLGAATSADLAERGWAAWNIEYRRVGNGGGWPTTFTDVAAAIDHVTRLEDLDASSTASLVTLGHSAGGQLAAWAASRDGSTPGGPPAVKVTAVVPQAGVLDLATAAESGLGGSAVPSLVGGMPSRLAARYRLVDPVQRLPLGVPVRCVHGSDDSTVPIAQSRAYVDAARAAGDDAVLVEVPGDHYALIDPSTEAWTRTVSVLTKLTEG